MVQQLEAHSQPEIIYPDSDGQPMADNTKQFRWIVVIKENLEILFGAIPDIFVAGDLLWYPIEGDNKTRVAPDVMVVFGRPKGDRGSYKQWEESKIPPQVVFEILSPGNRPKEMKKKFKFYQRYGVEEYYIYDPDRLKLKGWLRSAEVLEKIENINGWISPRLEIKFELSDRELKIFTKEGNPFLTFTELAQLKNQAEQQALLERQRAELERQRAQVEHQRAELEYQRAEQSQQQAELERQRAEKAQTRIQQLEAQLQAMGIDPQQL